MDKRCVSVGCAIVLLLGCGDDAGTGARPDSGMDAAVDSGSVSGAGARSGSGASSGSSSLSGSGGRSGSAGRSGSGSGSGPRSGSGSGSGSGPRSGSGSGSGGKGGNVSAPGCIPPATTAPSAAWTNVTGSLAGLASECGNLTLVAADPCSDLVIAGVAKRGLYGTRDRGATWDALGSGAGSAAIVHRPASIVFDPEKHDVFYESGIYGALNDGIYKTEDGGATFAKLGTIGHIDLVSVDFGDPARKVLLAGVHETKRKLFRSTDGGANWSDIGMKLPDGSHFSSAPLVLDDRRFLLGACGWGDGTCGVFASADGGESWKSTSTESPAGQPLRMRSGEIVWPTIYGSGAIVSDDAGDSWTKVTGPRAGSPVELPDGRIVAVGDGHLIASSDAGKSWKDLGEPLPYPPAGVAYSPSERAFFIWRNDCKEAVLPDAIMSAGLPD